MTDNGRELALTLALDGLARVENTLDRVRQKFDRDEGSRSFVLEHDSWCAKVRGVHGQHCGCGYDAMHESLRDAVAETQQVRAAINRCIVKSEVAK